jgi:streptomycin 6-kinase
MQTNNLNNYLSAWDLTDPQPLAQTVTSHVYTVTYQGARVVLKLLTEIGFEERSGAAALRYFDGRGAVRLLREDQDAHLLEYADGEDLIGMVKSGDDQKATAIIADVLNELHASQQAPFSAELDSLRVWFRSLFKKAAEDQRAGIDSIYIRAAKTSERLFADPQDVRVIHGDIHHENIRYKAGRGWLAFDPKGLVGERTYDAANTLCNPLDMPDLVENEGRMLTNAEILSQKMGIERSRILAFVFGYTCLSASWYFYDGVDAPHDMALAKIVEPHVREWFS